MGGYAPCRRGGVNLYLVEGLTYMRTWVELYSFGLIPYSFLLIPVLGYCST